MRYFFEPVEGTGADGHPAYTIYDGCTHQAVLTVHEKADAAVFGLTPREVAERSTNALNQAHHEAARDASPTA